jgi:hypothetical protein
MFQALRNGTMSSDSFGRTIHLTSSLQLATSPLVSLGVRYRVSVGLEHDPNRDTPILLSRLQKAYFLCCWLIL